MALLFGIVFCGGLAAEDASALASRPMSLQELVSGMARMDKARIEALRDYSSLRRYTLVNSRFNTRAEITVRMTYRYPGTKVFQVLSEEGSQVIRKSVLRRLIKTELEATRNETRRISRITEDNYTFRLLGTTVEQGHGCYVLEAEPKSPGKLLFRGRIWVEPTDFAIIRIEGSPALSPSMWVRKTTFIHQYSRFDRFWLPVSNHSENDVRIFGQTEVKVEYSDYRINEGGPAISFTGSQDVLALESEDHSAHGSVANAPNGTASAR